jgi:hypothetical protein
MLLNPADFSLAHSGEKVLRRLSGAGGAWAGWNSTFAEPYTVGRTSWLRYSAM